MTVLITGVAGFIGFHLATHLTSRGVRVHGIDSLNASPTRPLKESRLEVLRNKPLLTVQVGDLCDIQTLASLPKRHNFSAVVHLAARPGVRVPTYQWSEYVKSNVLALTEVLRIMEERSIERLLYASSSSVYGTSVSEHGSYEGQVRSPQSVYALTKALSEDIVGAFAANVRVQAIGLRFFSVYGPWGRPDMLIWRVIASAMTGSPVRINGDGRHARDFTFVDDLTRDVGELLDLSETQIHDAPGVMNIGGTGVSRSIHDVIQIVEEQMGTSLNLEFGSADPRDAEITRSDQRLNVRVLGARSATPLEEGIRKTSEWMLSQGIGRILAWSDPS